MGLRAVNGAWLEKVFLLGFQYKGSNMIAKTKNSKSPSIISRACICALLLSGGSQLQAAVPFDTIIDANAEYEMLGDQFKFTEGPVWYSKRLVFSDVADNKLYQWTEKEGFSVFKDSSGFANGNTLDGEGRLVSAQHNRNITRTDSQGKTVVITSNYKGKKYNSPNDVVVSSQGDIYFTDPPFGLSDPVIIAVSGPIPIKGMHQLGPEWGAQEEQAVRGIYRVRTDGVVTLLSGGLTYPNGLAFSPDEKQLYVSETQKGNIYVYDAAADGALSNMRVFAIQPVPEGGVPGADGLKVDRLGNVYAAAANGIAVYTPQGEYIGLIKLPARPTNLCWGEHGGKSLYITTMNGVYRIRTKIGGQI